MNRKFFTSCHRIVTLSVYSRPLFTSRLFGLSRFDRLRVTTGIKGVVDLDIKNDANHRVSRIIKFTSTHPDRQEIKASGRIDSNPQPEEAKGSRSKQSIPDVKDDPDTGVENVDIKKASLFQRFKAMYRDYWYVLIPVHVATSVGWYVGFYYVAKSGIDIVAIAESIHLSESLTDKLRHGGTNVTGYLAIAYALYKIATPLRYTVTLGGTTVTINYLKKWGYIKPILKKADLKRMYSDKKESLKGCRDEMRAYMVEKLSSKKKP